MALPTRTMQSRKKNHTGADATYRTARTPELLDPRTRQCPMPLLSKGYTDLLGLAIHTEIQDPPTKWSPRTFPLKPKTKKNPLRGRTYDNGAKPKKRNVRNTTSKNIPTENRETERRQQVQKNDNKNKTTGMLKNQKTPPHNSKQDHQHA